MMKQLVSNTLALAVLASGCAVGDDLGTHRAAHTSADAGKADAFVPRGCTLTPGFWKNHEDEWPVSWLVLGFRVYDAAALDALLESPTRGDATITLARHLIAAKLNVASGASSIPAIGMADAWLVANDPGHPLPYGIHPKTVAGQEAIAIAAELADYNEGSIGPGHCDD